MADPLLGDNYPTKGLYQALAVAAMCLQEEADTRPLISDVVTALEFLANKVDGEGEKVTKETFASQGGNHESKVVNNDDDNDDEDGDDENDDDDEDDYEDGDDDDEEDEDGDNDNDNDNDNDDDKVHRRYSE